KLSAGRIRAKDVEAVLDRELGELGSHDVAGVGSRLDLWRAIVLHGIPDATGPGLSLIWQEPSWLSRSGVDWPASARSVSAALGELDDPAGEERRAVRRLWDACNRVVGRAGEWPAPATFTPTRHRDWLRAACGVDTDSWIHPPLIRFLAGYLDQGLAHWPMPERNRGIHGCFLEIYGSPLAAPCRPP